ncbi:MAG TPA: SRPBCC family protein [Drouetiella sp.]|jgi:ribosome-associated toxin RatA of RatAB toxin-antitoxin module
MIRPLITACGVLAIFAASFTACEQSASAAAPQAPQAESYSACEEQIGPRVYQVSRVVINAAPNQVQDVITDYDHTEKVFDNVSKCKVMKEDGDVKQVAFTVKTLGSLMSCDYVLEIKSTPGRIEWKRVSGAFKANEGFWKFEPTNGGRATLVTYAKFIDGGMFAPKFIVNREIRNSMPVIMANLKSTAEHDSAVAARP